MNDPIVGIDLGTSNSVVAYADATGIVKVLADDSGAKVHPSVVSFHPNGGVVIGAAAKQRKVIDPSNTIYSVKRLIGRSYRSPEVQTAKTRSPFQIKEGQNNAPLIVTRGGEFAVPEISAIVLDHVRNIASARLECQVGRAVVTVPASFNDAQRSATATAGAIAGLTVVRVLNEPTAAALAYGHTRQLREIIAVYDFGGGTFDITILKLEDQVYEVLGTSGDTFLGGDDLDERLVDRMVAKFLSENRIDLRTNEVAMMRLRAVAEQTKIELSRRSRAVVRIDEIAYGARGAPLNLHIEITRDEFVKVVSDLVDRTFPVCTEALALANLSVDRIADVILVGGTTKIPYVRDQVGRYFGKLPRADVNPEDAVAAGAALQATALERILSRRTSSIKAPPHAPDVSETNEVTAVTNDLLELEPQTGATMAPSELTLTTRPKRPTAAYPTGPIRTAPEPKPDTSYSVTRAGVRDQVADPVRYPAAPANQSAIPSVIAPAPTQPTSFESRTPAVPTQPLARITRPSPAVAPPTPVSMPIPTVPPPTPVSMPIPTVSPGKPTPPPIPTVARTVFGAAPAPAVPTELDVDMDSAGVTAADPLPVVRPPSLPSSRQTPRSAQSVLTTAQLPTVQRAPHTPHAPIPSVRQPFQADDDWGVPDSSAGTNPAAWLSDPTDVHPEPLTTLPLAPVRPIAPPTEPTLIAPAPGYPAPAAQGRGPNAQTLLAAPIATTARGFQAPQSFPIQPEMPLRAPAKSTAPPPRAPLPSPIVLEVTPRGLGIATVAGFCEELIRRNARVPTETKKLFTTSRDQQDLVRIVVCQGESRRLENNTVIGDLILQNLPRRPRGETSIEVTFSLDASGVLHVRARDAETGVEQRASLYLVGDVAQEDVAVSRDRLQQLRR